MGADTQPQYLFWRAVLWVLGQDVATHYFQSCTPLVCNLSSKQLYQKLVSATSCEDGYAMATFCYKADLLLSNEKVVWFTEVYILSCRWAS